MMPTLDEATADPPENPQEFPKDLLSAWMRHMESYGQVWYEDIGRDYFNQEYWYLLVIAMVRYWRREPLYIGDACDCMKTGSARTRETRLRRLFEPDPSRPRYFHTVWGVGYRFTPEGTEEDEP